MNQIVLQLLLADATVVQLEEIIVSVVFFIIGFVFIGLAIPLLYEKIKPNWWYGFRTTKTLSNEAIWYKANKYMAKYVLVLGCVQVIYNLISIFLPLNILLGNMSILVGGTIIMLIGSLWYLSKL